MIGPRAPHPSKIVQIRWQRGARERRKPNPGSRLEVARGLNPVIFSSPASAAQQHQLHAPPCLLLCLSARVGLAAARYGSTRVSSQTPVDAACPRVRWRSHRVCGPGPCRCCPSPDVGVSAQRAPPPPLEAAQGADLPLPIPARPIRLFIQIQTTEPA